MHNFIHREHGLSPCLELLVEQLLDEAGELVRDQDLLTKHDGDVKPEQAQCG